MTSVKCPASTQHQLAEKEYRILAKLHMDSTKTFTKTWEIKTLSFKKKISQPCPVYKYHCPRFPNNDFVFWKLLSRYLEIIYLVRGQSFPILCVSGGKKC